MGPKLLLYNLALTLSIALLFSCKATMPQAKSGESTETTTIGIDTTNYMPDNAMQSRLPVSCGTTMRTSCFQKGTCCDLTCEPDIINRHCINQTQFYAWFRSNNDSITLTKSYVNSTLLSGLTCADNDYINIIISGPLQASPLQLQQ